MKARRYRVYASVCPLIAVLWLLMAFLDPDPGAGVVESLGLGFFFGSMFAQTSLAAAWTAFGPGRLYWRLPLSLGWVAMVVTGVGINIVMNGGPKDAAPLVGVCLFSQWLVLQLPFWGLALGLGMHLRHIDDSAVFDPRERQFGIRQLIIITAIVGAVLGLGRVVVTQLGSKLNVFRDEGPIILALAIASIVVSLPLLLAGLMRRNAIPGVVIALVLIGIATAWELPLLQSVIRGSGPGTDDFIAINAFTSLITLAVVAIVRLNGYALAVRGTSGKVA